MIGMRPLGFRQGRPEPRCGFVGPMAALIIGAVVSCVCFIAVNMKGRFGYDDTLDVFGVHCVGGMWGALATGLFASLGAQGLFYGKASQLGVQAVGVAAVLVFAMVMTFLIAKVLDATIGLRVNVEHEMIGLDQT